MNTPGDDLIAAVVSLGFPKEPGILIAKQLGHPKAIRMRSTRCDSETHSRGGGGYAFERISRN